jgi:tRNA pseudouridine32 synthase / 23S rRNA pseudouridine746 synthase
LNALTDLDTPALEPRWLDDQLLVLDKPAGLLSVPGRGADKADCLWARAALQWPDVLVVHRLDMATSGLLLFARDALTQRLMSQAFAERQVHKTYEAVVAGLVAPDCGSIALPLAADWPQRPRQQVDLQRGKSALTHWQVLARDVSAQQTRLQLTPHTGRSHQLRVHLCAIGHPIVGDALYAPPAVAAASARLLLHASALAFTHPHSGVAVQLDCETPF